MTKILLVLGSGGHTDQMLRLKNSMKKEYDYSYLIPYEGKWSALKVKENKYFAHMPKKVGDTFVVTVLRTLRCTAESLVILLKTNPDVVISAGPGIAVPISFLAKLFGKKVAFLESWSRVYNPSSSGVLVYKIADLFFIQWPEMEKHYPNALYKGRLA